ncbi:MAG: hypothetical protein JNJ89_16485 [Rubrivivax sp.]|nr:hypothetical protein [Rubrivivax sp.]
MSARYPSIDRAALAALTLGAALLAPGCGGGDDAPRGAFDGRWTGTWSLGPTLGADLSVTDDTNTVGGRLTLDTRTFEVAGTVDSTGALTLTGRTLPDPLVPCLQVTNSNLRLAGNQITGTLRRVTYGNPNCTGGGTGSSNGPISLARS